MLENTNKNKYIMITSSACDELSAKIERWIKRRPRKFQKWASPFGHLECECTSVGFDEYGLDEHEYQREILVAAWRLDAPFYKGEICDNAPDIVVEYFESDDPFQDDVYFYNWRVCLRRSVLERDEKSNLKQLIVQALLKAEVHVSDKSVLLDTLEWGEPS